MPLSEAGTAYFEENTTLQAAEGNSGPLGDDSPLGETAEGIAAPNPDGRMLENYTELTTFSRENIPFGEVELKIETQSRSNLQISVGFGLPAEPGTKIQPIKLVELWNSDCAHLEAAKPKPYEGIWTEWDLLALGITLDDKPTVNERHWFLQITPIDSTAPEGYTTVESTYDPSEQKVVEWEEFHPYYQVAREFTLTFGSYSFTSGAHPIFGTVPVYLELHGTDKEIANAADFGHSIGSKAQKAGVLGNAALESSYAQGNMKDKPISPHVIGPPDVTILKPTYYQGETGNSLYVQIEAIPYQGDPRCAPTAAYCRIDSGSWYSMSNYLNYKWHKVMSVYGYANGPHTVYAYATYKGANGYDEQVFVVEHREFWAGVAGGSEFQDPWDDMPDADLSAEKVVDNLLTYTVGYGVHWQVYWRIDGDVARTNVAGRLDDSDFSYLLNQVDSETGSEDYAFFFILTHGWGPALPLWDGVLVSGYTGYWYDDDTKRDDELWNDVEDLTEEGTRVFYWMANCHGYWFGTATRSSPANYITWYCDPKGHWSLFGTGNEIELFFANNYVEDAFSSVSGRFHERHPSDWMHQKDRDTSRKFPIRGTAPYW
jgi:hypothetical protein